MIENAQLKAETEGISFAVEDQSYPAKNQQKNVRKRNTCNWRIDNPCVQKRVICMYKSHLGEDDT